MGRGKRGRVMRLPQDRILHIDTELKNGKVNIVAEWQGELVRCKDCKRRYSDGHIQWCREWEHGTSENGYCHKADPQKSEVEE